MTEAEKINRLKKQTGETDEDLLATCLELAAEKIINKAYPYQIGVSTVPNKYIATQLEIACYIYNKRGAEGETAHNENGINRSYESAGVPASMLASVVPFVGAL